MKGLSVKQVKTDIIRPLAVAISDDHEGGSNGCFLPRMDSVREEGTGWHSADHSGHQPPPADDTPHTPNKHFSKVISIIPKFSTTKHSPTRHFAIPTLVKAKPPPQPNKKGDFKKSDLSLNRMKNGGRARSEDWGSSEDDVENDSKDRKESSSDDDDDDDDDERESRFFCFIHGAWRIFYLTAWFCAAIYSMYNIGIFVTRFFDKPTQTLITSVKPKDGQIEFPTISICNMNGIEQSVLDVDPVLNEVWTRLENSQRLNWKDREVAEIGNMTYPDIYRKAFSWEKVVDQCKYGGWQDCDTLNYHVDDLFEEHVGGSGKCYIFNPKGSIFSKGSGDNGGFSLLMNVHVNEYMANVPEIGFFVDVHHHTRNTGGNKIEMSPGYKYKVGVKKKVREELPVEVGGSCDPQKIKNSYGAYDITSCEDECRDRFINMTCGCILSSPPYNIYGYKLCTIKQMDQCGWLAYYDFIMREENQPGHLDKDIGHTDDLSEPRNDPGIVTNNTVLPTDTPILTTPSNTWPTTSTLYVTGTARENLNCSFNCSIPCTSIMYDLMVSTSKISRRYAEQLADELTLTRPRRKINASYVLDNHVLMQFYFKDVFTEVIAMTPAYSLWNLLSDIGGVMGLFLGASIFSFFSFFKVTTLRIYHYFKSAKDVFDMCRK